MISWRISNIFTLLTLIVLVSLELSDQAFACSRLWRSYRVGGEVVIEVENKGHLLPGAGVRVLQPVGPSYVYKTVTWQLSNDDGQVVFRDLRPGRYRILATHAGVDGEQADVEVTTGGSHDQQQIKLQWPLSGILETRAVEGSLYAGAHPSLLTGATLSLSRLFPDQPPIRVQTDRHGEFDFHSVPEGLYILNIAEREDADAAYGVDGNLFVEVKRDALRSNLSALLLLKTSCGLASQTYNGNIDASSH